MNKLRACARRACVLERNRKQTELRASDLESLPSEGYRAPHARDPRR